MKNLKKRDFSESTIYDAVSVPSENRRRDRKRDPERKNQEELIRERRTMKHSLRYGF